jgi:hypothetical protein
MIAAPTTLTAQDRDLELALGHPAGQDRVGRVERRT